MNAFSLNDTYLHPIDRSKSYKPLDFSGGGITGSVHHDGRFVSVNLYHPKHGYATLNALEPFGDDGRFDADAVRDYRAGLLTTEGFGLQILEPTIGQDTFLLELLFQPQARIRCH